MTPTPFRITLLSLALCALVACGGRSTLSDFSLGGAPESATEPSAAADEGDEGDAGTDVGGEDGEGGEGDEGGEGGEGAVDEGPPEAGDACDDSDDCGPGECAEVVIDALGGEVEAPGGYCTLECEEDEDCGSTGVCSTRVFSANTCYAACEEDDECRDGYVCGMISGGLFSDPVMGCTPEVEDGGDNNGGGNDGNGGNFFGGGNDGGNNGGGTDGNGGNFFGGGNNGGNGGGNGGGFDPTEFCNDNCDASAVDECIDSLSQGGFALPDGCGFGFGGG